ncbi:hypothetical protein BGW38_007451 [Lunasporangiospora selenospora]|uniref:Uncharacterized protein n=1 Tax=Lunasporangiospora selenospora TaxID=979761 RepID=A0A9P6KGJ6_9FUNG|nr:hypothetical protein BGW38_007451 [Lunasporangiospora selenospora]
MANGQRFQCTCDGASRPFATLRTFPDKILNVDIVLWESIQEAFQGARCVFKGDMMVEPERGPDFQIQPNGSSSSSPSLENQQSQSVVISEANQDLIEQDIRTLDWDSATTVFDEMDINATSPPHDSMEAEEHFYQIYHDLALNYVQALLSGQVELARNTREKMHEPLDELEPGPEVSSSLRSKLEEMRHRINSIEKELTSPAPCLKAFLTQTHIALDSPTPRLFIILPATSYDLDFDPSIVPIRLHFLCESGLHAADTDSSESTTHTIHAVGHAGYYISESSKFLEEYGAYVMAVLQMAMLGATAKCVTVPPLDISDIADHLGATEDGIDYLRDNLGTMLEHAIAALRNRLPIQDHDSFSQTTVDFNRLETHLGPGTPRGFHGGLFRTVSEDGTIKWVCRSHLQERYAESIQQQFLDILQHNFGTMDEHFGRVTIRLSTRQAARQFYRILRKIKTIVELDMALEWDLSEDDLRDLKSLLEACYIPILRLDGLLLESEDSAYGSVIDIIAKSRAHSLTLFDCGDWLDQSSLPSGQGILTLRSIGLLECGYPGMEMIEALFNTCPNLSKLTVESNLESKLQSIDLSFLLLGATRNESNPEYELQLRKIGSPKTDEALSLLRSIHWRQLVRMTLACSILTQQNLTAILRNNPQLRSITIDYASTPRLLDFIGVSTVLKGMDNSLGTVTLKSTNNPGGFQAEYNQGRITKITLIEGSFGTSSKPSLLDFPNIIAISRKDSWPWRDSHGLINVGEWNGERYSILRAFLLTCPFSPQFEINCTDLHDKYTYAAAQGIIGVCAGSLSALNITGIKPYHWLLEGNSTTLGAQDFPMITKFFLGNANFSRSSKENAFVDKLVATVTMMGQSRRLDSLELGSLQLSQLGWKRLWKTLDYSKLHCLRLTHKDWISSGLSLELICDYVPKEDPSFTLSIPGLRKSVSRGELPQSSSHRLEEAFRSGKTHLEI